jgi:tetratricopeptide (TPR) repeat protein
MDHPNIAKVFDGGTTDTGRPFFVMELVRGQRITDYCDQNNLPTRERLALFVQVCQAIQHAHQKGIIHRDIKPSNVLVSVQDGVPMPKVIDFGIAKATDRRLTEKTLFTAFEPFMGTPAYMSPEQAELGGLDIDTRTDIYSLGVLLYELLTGKTPFDAKELQEAGLDQMRRTIREEQPMRPSTRLNQELAAADLNRRKSGGGHDEEFSADSRRRLLAAVALLRGDLDWIVMKCLEKDRARRYETASGVALDIQRYLSSEPVLARPPSNWYRFRMLVRRNRLAFASAGAVAAALVIGLGVSIWLFLKEKQARQRAVVAEKAQSQLFEQAEKARQNEARLRLQAQADQQKAQTEAARSQQVAQFLKDMLKGVGPSVARGRDTVMLREILDNTATRVCQDLTNQPEVEMDLCLTLATVYDDLGLDEQEEEMAREAVLLGRSVFGEGHPVVAGALRRLGYSLSNLGKLNEAEVFVREALVMQRKLFGNESPDAADSLNTLGNVQWGQGKLAEAEATHREALAMRRELLGNDDPTIGESLNDLAGVLTVEGKLAEAGATYGEALVIARKAFGNQNPSVPTALNNLASVLKRQGKLAEAEPLFREALAIEKKLLGNEHPTLAVSLRNLASLLRDQGRLDEAETVFGNALEMQRRLLGGEHPDVATTLESLARLLKDRGKLADAEVACRECLAIRQQISPDDWQTFNVRGLMGTILLSQKRYEEVGPLLISGYEGMKQREDRIPPADKPRVKEAARHLVEFYKATGKPSEAAEWQKELDDLR